jgi:hypothetical protein
MIGPYAEAVGGEAGRAMPDFPLHKPTTERLFRVILCRSPAPQERPVFLVRADFGSTPERCHGQTFVF